MTHHKGLANVAESAEFLISYAKSLGMVHGAKEVQLSSKGKEAMDQGCVKIREKEGSGPDRTGNCPGGVDQA
jgi:hypothetical protein